MGGIVTDDYPFQQTSYRVHMKLPPKDASLSWEVLVRPRESVAGLV